MVVTILCVIKVLISGFLWCETGYFVRNSFCLNFNVSHIDITLIWSSIVLYVEILGDI